GVSEYTAICFVGLGSVATGRADFRSAETYLAAASANIGPSTSQSSNTVIRFRVVKASIALAEGRLDEARAELDAAIAASGSVNQTMRALLPRAEVNLRAGRLAAAEEDARRVLSLAQNAQGSIPYSSRTGRSWLMLGQVLKQQGDRVGAR